MSVSEQPGEPVAAKSTADGRRTLGITCSAHFVHDGIADAFYVLLPIWAQAFGLSLRLTTGQFAPRDGKPRDPTAPT